MMWIIWNDLFARSSLSTGDLCIMNKDSDIEVAVQRMLVCRYDNIVKQLDNFSRFCLRLILSETRLYLQWQSGNLNFDSKANISK